MPLPQSVWAHIFSSLSFAIYALVESFFVTLHIQKSWQTQLQVGLTFPNAIPGKARQELDNPPGSPAQLLPLSHIFSMSEFI